MGMVVARTTPPSISEGDDVSSLRFQAIAVFLVVGIAIVAVLLSLRRSNRSEAPSLRAKKRKGFDLNVAKMETLPLTRIASLSAGPAHIEGIVHSSVGKLGGGSGSEIVYMDKSGGGKQTAVASELIVVADDSGRAGVIHLERARVLGPREEVGAKAFLTLRIGDRVQVLGRFRVDRHGGDLPAGEQVYGFFGHDGPAQVRVLQRSDRLGVPSRLAQAQPPVPGSGGALPAAH